MEPHISRDLPKPNIFSLITYFIKRSVENLREELIGVGTAGLSVQASYCFKYEEIRRNYHLPHDTHDRLVTGGASVRAADTARAREGQYLTHR